ncbi:MAG: DUF4158 domain-containing protein, partial [Pseudomonadota bacterium]
MKQIWSKKELKENWSLSSREKTLVNSRREIFRLVFAVRLKFFGNYGYRLEAEEDVPKTILEYISEQIECFTREIPVHYWGSRAYRDHNLNIRQHYNFKIMTERELGKLKLWLWEEQFKLNPTHSKLG